MESFIKTALALNEHVRIFFMDSKKVCEDARLTHNLYPTSAATLGRVLTITAIMADMYKADDEQIDVSINGGGPIGTIMVTAKKDGTIKGFCGDPSIYLKYNQTNKLAVGMAVGVDGYLKVTRHEIRNNFSGQVKLQTGEIGDDFAYYFMQSEQTPSIVSLGVLIDTDNSVKAAGGLVIQLMPGHTEEDIVYLENALSKMRPISSLLDEGKTCKEILDELFTDYKFMDDHDVRFVCDCSKQRFRAALTTIKLEDLIDLYEKDKHIEVKCEYCNKKYEFDEDELNTIITYVQNQRLGN